MNRATPRFVCALLLAAFIDLARAQSSSAGVHTLADSAARLVFEQTPDGWRIRELSALAADTGNALPLGQPSGRYTFLFSPTAPDPKPVGPALSEFYDLSAETKNYYIEPEWSRGTTAVSLNTSGEAHSFFPRDAERRPDGQLTFRHANDVAELRADYALDRQFPGDLQVTLTLTARRPGFFSLATPTLATLSPAELAWAVVPGHIQGSALERNLLLSYGYGQGLPDRPVILRDRSAATLTSIATSKSGVSLAVTAEPGTATDPWASDRSTRARWQLGLSHMNRSAALAPTLYHPVLGELGSELAVGDTRTFRFRYTLRNADWFVVQKHVVENIYRFPASLALREPTHSLTHRIRQQHRYVRDDETSLWRLEDFEGLRLGAQSYMGAVIGAKERGDSIKNSDYGAMWMLAKITADPKLVRDRLPFARNFKLKQVQAESGFFQGAAVGQYYLPSSKRFTEEWGDYVEPVALTHYALLDLGNILLFAPHDTEARARFQLSADRLLRWQRANGSFEVGYSRKTEKPVFTDLVDYRPTFYGLLVAYRVLGDEKYLAAARRGADWLVDRSVREGKFLGVCGDVRFVPDFATGQIAQAMLDLHAATGDTRYRDAGIAAARFYTTSVYTHPIASSEPRTANNTQLPEWKINQAGLSFEHGGLMGSAVNNGPILLASHAGLFIRVHQLTGETLFRDMARSAAVAREAFVNPENFVASYYWSRMNDGPGRFPHHAWWQIGWITDYLMSELALRSNNAVSFPRGFFTPKVGPHASYGFAPGKIYGEPAELSWGDVAVDSPAIDCVIARSPDAKRVYLLLMNEVGREKTATVSAAPAAFRAQRWSGVNVIAADGQRRPLAADAASWSLTLPGYGLTVLALDAAP